jgi:hypothetical protein
VRLTGLLLPLLLALVVGGTAVRVLQRLDQGVPSEDSAEAFRWSEIRTVTKTALVSLHGNRYQIDLLLVGRQVELVFDHFDLSYLRVRLDGTDAGRAEPPGHLAQNSCEADPHPDHRGPGPGPAP